MAVTATPVFPQTPKITPQRFVQGTDSAGTFKTLFTAGANGTKITAIIASTDDGSASHLLTLRITRSATSYVLNNFTLATNAGNDGSTSSLDLLNATVWPGVPVDNDGNRYLFLESGDTLELTFATALTAGKTIYAFAIGSNF